MDIKKMVVVAGAAALAFSFAGLTNVNSGDSVANPLPQVQPVEASSDALSSLQPKEVAAAVLYLGAKDNAAWKSLQDSASDGDGDLEVDLDDDDIDAVTEQGTGMLYLLTLDGSNAGMVNGYTLSQDGNTVYLYSESDHDSAGRTIAPFKTVSASQLIKAAHTSTVQDIANSAKIEKD